MKLTSDREYNGDRPLVDPVIIQRIVLKEFTHPGVRISKKRGWGFFRWRKKKS